LNALLLITSHPRCRLPKAETQVRLASIDVPLSIPAFAMRFEHLLVSTTVARFRRLAAAPLRAATVPAAAAPLRDGWPSMPRRPHASNSADAAGSRHHDDVRSRITLGRP
jgi:hypothetical protein